jgi:hypothetical protein
MVLEDKKNHIQAINHNIVRNDRNHLSLEIFFDIIISFTYIDDEL